MKVFRSHLSNLGNRFDCHFTVESVGSPGSLNNPILDAIVDANFTEIQNIDSALAFLMDEIHIVWKDKDRTNEIQLVMDKIEGDKTIIKIRDARRLEVVDYSLTDKISLEYRGNPYGLLKLLSRRNSLIQQQKTFSTGMGPIKVDTETRVEVNVTDVDVRDLLTNCIQLAGYDRIIWSNYTDGKAESPIVTVKFHGKSIMK